MSFKSGVEREFDLVVGADGRHSRVRDLVVGPQEKFERHLGYKAAAFEAPGYQPRDELAYVMYTEVGQQVGRFALRENTTMFLFTFQDSSLGLRQNGDIDYKALLGERFGRSGWECPQILDALNRASDIYFDRKSQIRMDSEQGMWTRGESHCLETRRSACRCLLGRARHWRW